MTTNPVSGYIRGIWDTSSTIFEGLVVTLANFLRRPITIQYPDRVPVPVVETLPPRYRGFVEVDPRQCTGCKLCATACPIDCIHIVVEKNQEKQRGMTDFSVDIGKCMYCGLCVEPCPTGAIRMSPNFEAAGGNLDCLVYRYIKPGEFIPPAKAKAALETPTPPRGELAEKAMREALLENADARPALEKAVRTKTELEAAAQTPTPEKPASKE
ncbi:MAG: NADH-quinone oxidoreductase subunit I [Deltaproteobacteria bacterium]|nr:NADH-quinone oxidoreductase subunit I [Deltaproteobacteria bacterium]